jgi:hypothetical protein
MEPSTFTRIKRDLGFRVHRVAELTEDYSSSRALPAFRALEEALDKALVGLLATTTSADE